MSRKRKRDEIQQETKSASSEALLCVCLRAHRSVQRAARRTPACQPQRSQGRRAQCVHARPTARFLIHALVLSEQGGSHAGVGAGASSLPTVSVDAAGFIRTFVSELLPTTTAGQSNFDKKLKNKVAMLENPHQVTSLDKLQKREQKRAANAARSKAKVMSSRERKERKMFQLPKEGLECVRTFVSTCLLHDRVAGPPDRHVACNPSRRRYKSFLPLHELWKGYMADLLGDEVSR